MDYLVLILAWTGPLAVIVMVLMVTARFEKRVVWPYGRFLQSEPEFGDPSGYGSRWVGDALEAGFTLLGWATDCKGPSYRISYALMVSPERDCFAIIGVGTLAKLRVQGTWLQTPLIDGRVYTSTDDLKAVEIDVSRAWMTQWAPVRSFAALRRKHQEWIQRKGFTPRRFESAGAIDVMRLLRERHYRAIAQAGLIVFTDGSASKWHYTYYGALKIAVLMLTLNTLRVLTLGRFPRTA